MVHNDRTPYLQELIRWSSEATLLIPTSVFNEETDVLNNFEDVRKALNWLENDDTLLITVKNLDNTFTEVNIKIRGDNNDQTID